MKNLLTLIALALVANSGADSAFDRMKQTLLGNGFTVQRLYEAGSDLPFSGEGSFVNITQGLHVSFDLGQSRTPAEKQAALFGALNTQGTDTRESTLSGFSMGEHSILGGSDTDYKQTLICDRYGIDVQVSWQSKGAQNTREQGKQLVRMWCERIGRRVLGEAMANDLNDDGSENGNAHLTGLEVNKDGMETLAVWAHARGVAVTYDAPTETASFSYHNKQVKLPLASNKAVVNGVEVSLGGKFILARRSTWFVPGAELTAAIG